MDFKQKKSVQAINYFARKEQDLSINRLKLMKILWLSDRLHLARYGRIILEDTYVAMKHGPVPSATKNISHNHHDPYISKFITPNGYEIDSKENVEEFYFSESEIEAMDAVWETFGNMGNFELRDLSHHYPEWKRYETEIEMTNSSFAMQLVDFFEVPSNTTDSKFDFFSNEDLEHSREIFNETSLK